ncbi:hypothetical protein PAHAL_2G330200 [Panicum hallii]|uniref:Uncharacterized protein n=1 Tax=Panicum hallii TaxID=206008 RepID=A0A2S3GZV1_9POAL|nr:hypothetical protein PAHAL_2G330200 [Panicum hallii]
MFKVWPLFTIIFNVTLWPHLLHFNGMLMLSYIFCKGCLICRIINILQGMPDLQDLFFAVVFVSTASLLVVVTGTTKTSTLHLY